METDEPTYLPCVSPADFEAFRVLLKDEIAPTYEIWLQRHCERILYWGVTSHVIEVDVNPRDFAEFCCARSRGHNGKALLDFAVLIGKAK